jgi:asparagine synthase (glutamine-hydrolysing)
MAFGIEARVPFLDHRLVEAALLLPDRLKIAGTERKVGLRRAVADLVPAAVLERRDKIAFQAPTAKWLSHLVQSGRVDGLELAASAGLVSSKGQRAGLCALAATPEPSYLWRLASVELWLRARL